VLHIETLEAFCAINRVDFAVLTTPWEAAPEIVERLSQCGVRGIWNFSNMELASTNKDMIIENMHFSDSLMKLCFDLKKASEEKKEE
ncbi:MAG: redox-sensing transcriptional repressor Rex, partial [Oscillospiraceae bacterium]|nr:redox-sensing transcriptional repressor Rex [Oscillospiraceae bacterium]